MSTADKLARILYARFSEPNIHIPYDQMPDKIQDGYKSLAIEILDQIGFNEMYKILKAMEAYSKDGLNR